MGSFHAYTARHTYLILASGILHTKTTKFYTNQNAEVRFKALKRVSKVHHQNYRSHSFHNRQNRNWLTKHTSKSLFAASSRCWRVGRRRRTEKGSILHLEAFHSSFEILFIFFSPPCTRGPHASEDKSLKTNVSTILGIVILWFELIEAYNSRSKVGFLKGVFLKS